MEQIKSPYIVPEYRDEYYSYFPATDLQGKVVERLSDPEPIRIPLGWFLLILSLDIAALVGIYAGIAKALGR